MVTGQVTWGLRHKGEGSKRFLGVPPLGMSSFVRRGSATAQEVTRGGSTAAIPPISRTLTFGRVGIREGPLVVDLVAGRSDGWREGRGDGGLVGVDIRGNILI